MKLSKLLIFFLIPYLIGCKYFSAGTLGAFPPITFPTTKAKLEVAIDSLFSAHPEYSIPVKWKDRDNWSEMGYDFLESRIFYFSSEPEEMYYVTFIGDDNDAEKQNSVTIAIRAVGSNTENWLGYDELKEHRREQVVRRFQKEIILKLESYSGIKSHEGY